MICDKALSGFTAEQKLGFKWHSPEKADLHIFAHFSGSTGDRREYFTLTGAVRTHKSTHILYNTQDWCFSLFAKVYFFSHIAQSYLLRGSDYNCTCNSSLF
jgi:hypothetical protein